MAAATPPGPLNYSDAARYLNTHIRAQQAHADRHFFFSFSRHVKIFFDDGVHCSWLLLPPFFVVLFVSPADGTRYPFIARLLPV